MATVTGTIKDKKLNILALASVKFKCTDGATVSGAATVINADTTTKTNASGVMSVTLAAGNYQLWVDNVLQTTIGVPAGSGTYQLEDLVGATVAAPNVLSGLTFLASDGNYVRVTAIFVDGSYTLAYTPI